MAKGDISNIAFSKEETAVMVSKLQDYFEQELDQDLGQFDAEFLLEFLSKQLGPYFYNRGLYDAQAVFESRLENIAEAIYEIEKPTAFNR